MKARAAALAKALALAGGLGCCASPTGLAALGNAGACFSADRRFRYLMWRRWADGPTIGWCMLNPSKADEIILDRTNERTLTTSQVLGFGAMETTNALPLVSTDPRGLIAIDRDGEPLMNDAHILASAMRCDMFVLAFGANVRSPHLSYVTEHLQELLSSIGVKPMALALTADGLPRHPLYLPGGLQPVPFIWPGLKTSRKPSASAAFAKGRSGRVTRKIPHSRKGPLTP